jgi:hypothetical protein
MKAGIQSLLLLLTWALMIQCHTESITANGPIRTYCCFSEGLMGVYFRDTTVGMAVGGRAWSNLEGRYLPAAKNGTGEM